MSLTRWPPCPRGAGPPVLRWASARRGVTPLGAAAGREPRSVPDLGDGGRWLIKCAVVLGRATREGQRAVVPQWSGDRPVLHNRRSALERSRGEPRGDPPARRVPYSRAPRSPGRTGCSGVRRPSLPPAEAAGLRRTRCVGAVPVAGRARQPLRFGGHCAGPFRSMIPEDQCSIDIPPGRARRLRADWRRLAGSTDAAARVRGCASGAQPSRPVLTGSAGDLMQPGEHSRVKEQGVRGHAIGFRVRARPPGTAPNKAAKGP